MTNNNFFRDKQQIKILSETLLPTIIQKKRASQQRSLRIWSAGCSSGEEIYTIVMLLKELLPDIDNWESHFLATDINIDLLKKGINGRYGEWSMRSIPDEYLTKYFRHEGKYYQLDNEIKKYVDFDYLNLIDDTYPAIINGTAMQDLIICRNVLIYFDNEHIAEILTKFSKCLANDGYLMLGASDPIAIPDDKIEIYNNTPSIFCRRLNRESKHQSTQDLIDGEISVSEPVKPVSTQSTVNIEELLSQSKWHDLIDYANQNLAVTQASVSLLNAKALALANIGHAAEALATCAESLALDKMKKESHYLHGLLLAENKQLKQAESALRKALYIDQEYLMCRYQLGLFLLRLQRHEEGLKALESVMKSAEKFESGSIVPDSQNMTYKQLIEILKAEILLHQQSREVRDER